MRVPFKKKSRPSIQNSRKPNSQIVRPDRARCRRREPARALTSNWFCGVSVSQNLSGCSHFSVNANRPSFSSLALNGLTAESANRMAVVGNAGKQFEFAVGRKLVDRGVERDLSSRTDVSTLNR